MILCADDFGLSPGIDKAILKLAQKGKINAVSVLILSPELQISECRRLISETQSSIQIGLHLILPGQLSKKFSFESAKIIFRHQLLIKYFKDQLVLFHQIFSRWPDFIDGHQHIHVYPGIRKALFEAVEFQKVHKFYFRSLCISPIQLQQKQTVYMNFLSFLGSQFKRQAEKRNFQVSGDLFGVFNAHVLFKTVFELAKKEAKSSDICFFHPGFVEKKFSSIDFYAEEREWDYEAVNRD